MSEDRLHTWKEIANYLKVTPKTVQQWEKTRQLPVHRIQMGRKGKKAGIVAYRSELETWLKCLEARPRRRLPWRLACGLAVVAAASAAAYSFLLDERHCRPVRPELRGSLLRALDQDGRLCWERDFPEARQDLDVSTQALAVDVDSDGSNEILFDFNPVDRIKAGLLCLDSKGKTRWEFWYGSNNHYQGRWFDDIYVGYGFQVITVGKRRILVAVTGHNSYFPSQVLLLDLETGQLLDQYWHPGRLVSATAAEPDAEGKVQVILGGVNNPNQGLGHPALLILEIPFAEAEIALDLPDYFPTDFTGGREKGYLLLPRPRISDAVGQITMVESVSVDSLNRLLVSLRVPTQFGSESAGLDYYFDASLRLIDVRPSDRLLAAYSDLAHRGRLPSDIIDSEKKSWRQVRSFPSAPDANRPEIEEMFN